MTNQEYLEKLKDPRWQKKRLEILKRDKWTCQYCRNTNETLVVHHKTYLPNTEVWYYPNDLLITLCETCHGRELYRTELEEIFINSLRKIFTCVDIDYMADYTNQKDYKLLSPLESHKLVNLFSRYLYDLDFRKKIFSNWETKTQKQWQDILNKNLKTYDSRRVKGKL